MVCQLGAGRCLRREVLGAGLNAMTVSELLDLIEEIRGNERYLASLRALIATGAAQPECKYAEVAIVDRLQYLNYRRERECGGIIERTDMLLRAGVTAASTDPTWPALDATRPPGRIH